MHQVCWLVCFSRLYSSGLWWQQSSSLKLYCCWGKNKWFIITNLNHAITKLWSVYLEIVGITDKCWHWTYKILIMGQNPGFHRIIQDQHSVWWAGCCSNPSGSMPRASWKTNDVSLRGARYLGALLVRKGVYVGQVGLLIKNYIFFF